MSAQEIDDLELAQGQSDAEDDATIEEITNILAQFEEEDATEEEGSDKPPDSEGEEKSAQEPAIQVILPPHQNLEQPPSRDALELDALNFGNDWTLHGEDFDYDSDAEEYFYQEVPGENEYTLTDQLLQEIAAFEQNLEDEDAYYQPNFNYGPDSGEGYLENDWDAYNYSHHTGGEGDPWPLSGDEGDTEDEARDRQEYFEKVVDTIPTIPGVEALDQAGLIEDVKDLLASFQREEAELSKVPGESGEDYVSPTDPVLYRCPSIESFFHQEDCGHGHHAHANATVFMYLLPGRKMISKEVRLDTTIHQLKSAVARYTRAGPELLDLRLRQNLLTNSKTLTDLGVKAGSRVRFTVELNQMAVMSEVDLLGGVEAANAYHHGPTVLGIRELDEDKEPEREDMVHVVNIGAIQEDAEVPTASQGVITPYQRTVVIVHPVEKKKMLGGFKNSRTALVYHDAATNTTAEETGTLEKLGDVCISDKEALVRHHLKKTKRCGEGLDKATQSRHETTSGSQTAITVYTQVPRGFDTIPSEPYYPSEARDVLITIRPYQTSEELLEVKAAAVTKIANFWRRILAKRERSRRLDLLMMRVAFAEKLRKGRIEERKKIMEEELERQKCPKRLLDLELLYREINNWRGEQESFIQRNRWGAEKKAALATLAEMEADLLLELERTKRRILHDRRDIFIQGQFKQMGLPKRWFNPKASVFLTVDTLGRKNCRKLHDVYNALLEPVPFSEDGRRNRLELIKGLHTLITMHQECVPKGHMPMADMLTELFVREIKFMNIAGVNTLLQGIRKRVATTFFYLCMDPSFNEEAERINPIPFDMVKLKRDMVQCRGCRRMLHKDEFTIDKGTTLTERCRNCTSLYRTTILRIDLNIYRQMLDELRRDEFTAGVVNSMAYLIDAFDMRVLMEQIWQAQSILSGNRDRYMLRLCRWDKKEPWTPWNCILLSEDEAVAHLYLEDMTKAYQPTLFHKVRVKHATAKVYFHGLAKLSLGLDDRVKETCARMKDSEKRAHAGIRRMRKKAQVLYSHLKKDSVDDKKQSSVRTASVASTMSIMSFASLRISMASFRASSHVY